MSATINAFATQDASGKIDRGWRAYGCKRCGGVIIVGGVYPSGQNPTQASPQEIYPRSEEVDASVPSPARDYLTQAFLSISAPAGSVMLSASAVDAMLKAKGYAKGKLYDRIEKAAADHLITAEMATWAHDVRLDANDQRHADVGAGLPTADDARRCIEFAGALASFLFVLPARVERGRKAAEGASSA